jgi:hypothetical protein
VRDARAIVAHVEIHAIDGRCPKPDSGLPGPESRWADIAKFQMSRVAAEELKGFHDHIPLLYQYIIVTVWIDRDSCYDFPCRNGYCTPHFKSIHCHEMEALMSLDPETRHQFVETIRRFVDERLIPRESEVADTDHMPGDIVQEMRDMGLFGLSIAQEYGGLGLTMEEEALVIFELGRAAPTFRSMFATNVGIGSQGIAIDGTDEQKVKYLPRLASGELIGSFALTEPEVGSDAGSVQTSARREGET